MHWRGRRAASRAAACHEELSRLCLCVSCRSLDAWEGGTFEGEDNPVVIPLPQPTVIRIFVNEVAMDAAAGQAAGEQPTRDAN